MTVSVSDRQSSNYSGPQSSGHEYEFSFRLHDASMLYVEITDGDGVKTEADPNDYSVTLNYDQYGNPGGIVTYDLALPDGSFLRVISRLEIQQQSELTATPSYVPRNVEDALDYLAMTMQDQGRAVDEAVNVAQDAAASAASAADSAASAAADADAAADSAASAAADADAAADSADALSTLQSGTPTNEAIAEGNTVQAALWKLQGQTLAARDIAYINTDAVTVGATTYTMTAEESAAAVWVFYGGTSDCTVTPVYNALTQGVKKIITELSTFDITIDGKVFGAGAYGAFDAFIVHNGTFVVLPLTDGVANSRVFEQDTTTYNLADLINGTYNYFSNASAVTLTVQPHATAAIPANAEYQIEARGAGGLTIVAGSGVTIIPPKGGSLVLAQGDFVKIKRTGVDEFKLIGTTV